jgi:DNA ligase-1
MPKQQQQSSLDSFFGVQASSKIKKQKTLTSFFNKDKDKDKNKDKENNSNNDDDDEKVKVKVPAATKNINSKRRAILDDTDDEDEPVVTAEENAAEAPFSSSTKSSEDKKPSPTVTPPPHPVETTKSHDETKKEEASKETTKTAKPKEEQKDEKEKAASPQNPEDVCPDGVCPHRHKLETRAKKLAKLAKVAWEVDEIGSPVLYQDLVETLEQIEAISSRLEIQALMTKLFRRVLQHSPKDMYTIIYLASNSIAPAYECVELGIGDSILIKAIGEAYGTGTGM